MSSKESSSSGLKITTESDAPPLAAVPELADGGGSGGSPIPPPPRVGAKRSGEEIDAAAGEGLVRCEICGAGFPSAKGLFGHMKVHKDRGWKGTRPPPAFDYLAEFSEFQHLLVKPHDQQENEEEEEVAGGGGATATQPPQAAAPAPAPGPEAEEYLLPDLNLPPNEWN